MQRCDCARGRTLAGQDLIRREPPTPLEFEPRISQQAAALGVSMLSTMQYFPTEEGARVIIAEELRAMCTEESQILWLAKRMGRLFSVWPGLPAMRAVFCARHVPLDRIPAENEASIFPDGVPAEVEPPQLHALPPGSDDPEFDAAIRSLAARKRLN
jgi:hypothetical protein